jgi:hypothetical protein
VFQEAPLRVVRVQPVLERLPHVEHHNTKHAHCQGEGGHASPLQRWGLSAFWPISVSRFAWASVCGTVTVLEEV